MRYELPAQRPDLQKIADQILLNRYAPASVVVTEKLDIVHFIGQTGRFLDPPPGEASLNLLKMVKPGLHLELRLAFQKARRDGNARKDGILVEHNGRLRTINFDIIPIKNVPGTTRHFIVVFEDVVGPALHPSEGKKNGKGKSDKKAAKALDTWLSLVKSVPEVLITVDPTGKILFANRSLWGRPAEALTGVSIFKLIPDAEVSGFREYFNQVFSSRKPGIYALQGVGPAPSWHELSFGPIREFKSENGKVTHATSMIQIRDVSAERNTAEKLRATGEQLRQFAGGIDAVREEERARVAREIHDELGQALTVTKLDLAWLQSKPPRNRQELRRKVKSMIMHVDATIERMRKIVSELRPSILDDLGLIPALEWQVKEFQKRTRIRCRLTANVEKVEVNVESAAAVFRVVQEALTNVMRHAKAKSVMVDVTREKGRLQVSVSDDGIGIAPETLRDLKSLGLVGMRERIFRVGGDFKIHSHPGSGTRIEIALGS